MDQPGENQARFSPGKKPAGPAHAALVNKFFPKGDKERIQVAVHTFRRAAIGRFWSHPDRWRCAGFTTGVLGWVAKATPLLVHFDATVAQRYGNSLMDGANLWVYGPWFDQQIAIHVDQEEKLLAWIYEGFRSNAWLALGKETSGEMAADWTYVAMEKRTSLKLSNGSESPDSRAIQQALALAKMWQPIDQHGAWVPLLEKVELEETPCGSSEWQGWSQCFFWLNAQPLYQPPEATSVSPWISDIKALAHKLFPAPSVANDACALDGLILLEAIQCGSEMDHLPLNGVHDGEEFLQLQLPLRRSPISRSDLLSLNGQIPGFMTFLRAYDSDTFCELVEFDVSQRVPRVVEARTPALLLEVWGVLSALSKGRLLTDGAGSPVGKAAWYDRLRGIHQLFGLFDGWDDAIFMDTQLAHTWIEALAFKKEPQIWAGFPSADTKDPLQLEHGFLLAHLVKQRHPEPESLAILINGGAHLGSASPEGVWAALASSLSVPSVHQAVLTCFRRWPGWLASGQHLEIMQRIEVATRRAQAFASLPGGRLKDNTQVFEFLWRIGKIPPAILLESIPKHMVVSPLQTQQKTSALIFEWLTAEGQAADRLLEKALHEAPQNTLPALKEAKRQWMAYLLEKQLPQGEAEEDHRSTRF